MWMFHNLHSIMWEKKYLAWQHSCSIINSKKSCCIKIVPKFKKPCYRLTSSTGNVIACSNSRKYLEVCLLAGRKFKRNFDEVTFLNCVVLSMVLWVKSAESASQAVTIELVRMKCLPVLLYGTETEYLLNLHIRENI